MHSAFFYRIKDIFTATGVKWDEVAYGKEIAIEAAHKYINSEPKRKNDQGQYSLEYCLACSGETINERFRNNHTEEIDKQIADMVETHKT